MTELNWSLLENALDSIQHAIEHYTSDTNPTRRYKYAVLHLSQGVTLLLKERLRREHPNFIYTNVAEEEGNTVDIEVALSRLKKIAKVEIDDSSLQAIKELAKLRNKIEHFAITLPKQQADSIIARIVPFLASFTNTELETNFQYAIGQDNWNALLDIQEYRNQAIRSAESRIKVDGKPAFKCERCQGLTAISERTIINQPQALILDITDISCLVCGEHIGFQSICPECSKLFEVLTEDLARRQDSKYCETCQDSLRKEFPEFRNPMYVAEVRRWFKTHDQITGEELWQLSYNVILAGSSRPEYLVDLFNKGIIDFAYESDKRQYQLLKKEFPMTYFDSNTQFVWAMKH